MNSVFTKWLNEQFYDKEVAHEQFSAEDMLGAFRDTVHQWAFKIFNKSGLTDISLAKGLAFDEIMSELLGATNE